MRKERNVKVGGKLVLRGLIALMLACACSAVPFVGLGQAMAAVHISGPSNAPSQSPGGLDTRPGKTNIVLPDDDYGEDSSSSTDEIVNVALAIVAVVFMVGGGLYVLWCILLLPWVYFIKPFLDALKGD